MLAAPDVDKDVFLKKALDIKPDYANAMVYIGLLYRQKAALETGVRTQASPRRFEASLGRIWAFARREMIELTRDRVRLAFALIGPLILMVTFGYGITFDVENLSFAVFDRDQSAHPPRTREELARLTGHLPRLVTGHFHVAPERQRRQAVVGAPEGHAGEARTESHGETQHAHAESLGHHEVSQLVDEDEHAEHEHEGDDVRHDGEQQTCFVHALLQCVAAGSRRILPMGGMTLNSGHIGAPRRVPTYRTPRCLPAWDER